MKVIDLLNKIANEEKLPKYIKINDITLCLNDEVEIVEILEDKTEEIEKITYKTSDANTMICIDKINELVRAVNKLNEPINTSKETNCMTD